jgi:predicted ATPase
VKDPHHSKLDKLLLVRFGGLPIDTQRVLRAASVIGVTFARDVLQEMLPRHLKDSLHSNLSLLVRQMWLYEDPDDDQLYAFSHPHAQQVLYELTPSSERNFLYEKIAECVEEKHGTDPAYFTALSHYYKHCDTDKALQYVVKAEAALLMDVTTMWTC